MNEDTTKSLNLLARRMKQQAPILFTGAGFSYKAKNARGVELPLGGMLKRKIISELLCIEETSSDYNELMRENLSSVYSYATDELGPNKSAEFLRNIFTDCIPLDFHRTIAKYPWRRIYTLNIDDLLENAMERQGLLNILNSQTPQKKFDPKAIDYVKLHGCVRNHGEGFVFSKNEYTGAITGRLDYRYSKLNVDLQTEDFIFIGATTDEQDIDFHNQLFNSPKDSRNGNFFYVDPKPGIILRQKIKSSGAHLLEMTCEEFAKWLDENIMSTTPATTPKRVGQANFNRSFRPLNELKKSQAKIGNLDSKLYFGFEPEWTDIFADWDFRHPITERIVNDIETMLNGSKENVVVTLLSKAMGGKSVLLKRVGNTLLSNGYDVLEYIGNNFNPSIFREYASKSTADVIVLLIDNASSYYNGITYLAETFPQDKRLVVVATARRYYHLKKHYDLSQLPGYRYYDLDIKNQQDFMSQVESAVKTLEAKLLLGQLKSKSHEERVRYFLQRQDIAEALWDLTHGDNFRRKLVASFSHVTKKLYSTPDSKYHNENWQLVDIMRALAIFHKADLPYIPNALLTLWKPGAYSRIDGLLTDLTKPMAPDGKALRTGILVNTILNNAQQKAKARIVKEILIQIAPLLQNPESYWNQIQSHLMNVRFLEHFLHISIINIKNLLYEIGPHFTDDPHYLIQLGILEQRFDDYPRALNHLIQAQELSKDSYNIRNAIARNYLRYASRGKDIDSVTAAANYEIGREQMSHLIYEKEHYQVRAYSVHSLIGESIDYWNRFSIIPTADELKHLIDCLNLVLDKTPDDPKIANTGRKLWRFINENNLKVKLPKFNLNSLNVLKTLMSDDEAATFLEDDEID